MGHQRMATHHLLALFVLVWLSACADQSTPKTAEPVRFDLRFGHDMPEASAQHVAAVRFAELLNERSGGKVNVSVHPAQSLGNDHAMIDMARNGELDFIVPPTAKLALVAPSMQLLDLPFFLSDPVVREKILDGRVGNSLLAQLTPKGLIGLEFWSAGTKHWTANKPLRTTADFEGLRFRVMKSAMLQAQFEALGASSVAIDFAQTRSALEKGVVDGQENPLTSIQAMGFHTVQSHLTLSGHGYLGQTLIISKSTLDKLPPEFQKLVREVAAEVTPFERAEAAKLAGAALETIRASGTTIVELTSDERENFQEATRKVIEKYRLTIGTSLVEQCLQILQEAAAIPKDALIVGLDADLIGNSALSGLAIRRGIELAIEEINDAGGVLGRPLHLRALDNSMVAARGLNNLRALAKLPNLVAVFGGISSPVVLAEIPLIHDKQIVFLDPWAAATNVVDNGHEPNYVFRASVRDEFAGQFLVDEAKKTSSSIALLLLENPWGHSNHRVMTRALEAYGLEPTTIEWFDWRETDFSKQVDRIYESGADVIIYVGNGVEAAKIITKIAARETRIPIISHWGISGSDFPVLAAEALGKVDLRVLQTFSFLNAPNAATIVAKYSERYGAKGARDIVAPVGTAHAYDLVHMLAMAIEKAGTTERSKIRDALETLERYEGLVRTYEPPFTAKRHEALTRDNYILARYEGTTLVPIQP